MNKVGSFAHVRTITEIQRTESFCMSASLVIGLFKLLGGLAFFLYGMNVMSKGLSKLAGGSLERSLKKMTTNRFSGMGLGAVITIAIQSSSAMTVMLVGLVNSGIMTLGQTIGVIMGSNIGTTLTPWIFSLSGISDDGWVSLLKPENFSLFFAFIGIVMTMMSKKTKHHDIGNILIGFAVLMFGMKLMGEPMKNMTITPEIQEFFSNPVLGVLVGAVFTGIIQSSAASVAILQGLAASGGISYGMAIPIIMGQNIGTCVTALISSIGVSKNAKKVSVVHITFNLIGTAVCLILYFGLDAMFHFSFTEREIGAAGIAMVHTVFNIFTSALLCPYTKQLEKIANWIIRPGRENVGAAFLDERLLKTPAVAVNEADAMTVKMANIARDSINSAIDLFDNYTEKQAQEVIRGEDELDKYEDKLGSFLVQLSASSLSDRDSRHVSKLLHTIGDLERLGDHAVQLQKNAEEIYDKKLVFTANAQQQLQTIAAAITEILDLTTRCFENNDISLARHVEPLEQVIDALIAQAKTKHIERLQAGRCTIQTGFVLSDILSNYQRISDHCSNVAVAVIETDAGSFDTHRYLNEVKESGSHHFAEYYNIYAEKFGIQ